MRKVEGKCPYTWTCCGIKEARDTGRLAGVDIMKRLCALMMLCEN
jgi:hypothetical protein